MKTRTVKTDILEIAFHEYGDRDGWPCILSHGFPYDVQAYAETAPILAQAGARVIVPYLRGYGPTRFLSAETLRSGEQAALGSDLLALMDALEIERAVIGGYDWGSRASCVVAALWPDRVTALVSGNSYNIQNIARSGEPAAAEKEASHWYQFYFHSERGRRGLIENRRDITRFLWRSWSPSWRFDDATFERSAEAFDNPDFVEVVIHSYRHRFGLVAGDPAVAPLEARLAAQPDITVPAITIDAKGSGLGTDTRHHAKKFTGPHDHRDFDNIGHNLPQQDPEGWARVVLDARAIASR